MRVCGLRNFDTTCSADGIGADNIKPRLYTAEKVSPPP